MNCIRRKPFCLVALFLIAATSPAWGAGPDADKKWEADLELHVWAALPGGTTSGGGDLDIDIADLIDDLDFLFMASSGARKGRWSVFGDIFAFNVDGQASGSIGLIGPPLNTSVGIDLSGWIVMLVGGYAVAHTDRFTLDVVFGVQHLGLKTDIALAIGNQMLPLSGSSGLLSGIVGIRGHADLGKHWYFSYGLAGGTGDTESTWQAKAGYGYRLDKLDAVFGTAI
jgi:hypothetical protein